MLKFYQTAYRQSGLTTELPSKSHLENLVETNFSGSSKDFTRFIRLFSALRIPAGSKILDFGANWGYGTYQFEKAGFESIPYEISKPRAKFGEQIGISVISDWADIETRKLFDVAFSAHVLEHTPDPQEAILRQIKAIRPGGYLIAVYPHGSRAFKEADPRRFHKIWGQVHPVLLTDRFIDGILSEQPTYMGSLNDTALVEISTWDQCASMVGNLTDSEMLLICKVQ